MIAFIDDHREVHGVEPICRVLPIAPSTYHLHAARQAAPAKLPPRAKSDAALKIEIRRVFEANFCVYGVRKVWRQHPALAGGVAASESPCRQTDPEASTMGREIAKGSFIAAMDRGRRETARWTITRR